MKGLKRFVSMVLTLCIMISLLPPVQRVCAAGETSAVIYKLDTDGIDPGAEYLIVSSAAGVDYIMQGGTSVGAKKAVTVVNGDTIQVVENEAEYLWTFETNPNTADSYYVKNSGRYLAISSYSVTSVDSPSDYPSNIFAYKDETQKGCYLIYTKYFSNNYYLYLGMYSAKFTAYSNTDLTEVTTRQRLFKKVTAEEPAETYTVSYDANGGPVEGLPAGSEGLEENTQYQVLAPAEGYSWEDDNNIYSFAGWNTAADGKGTSYAAGKTLAITENVTLYAQWTAQAKQALTVTTKLDGVNEDMTIILNRDTSLFVQKGALQLPLTRTSAGVYTTQVTEDGTYTLYFQYADGSTALTGYTLDVKGQGAAVDIGYHSVNYMHNGVSFRKDIFPAGTQVTVMGESPYDPDNRFLGWEDENGKLLSAGAVLTQSLDRALVLTAKWEKIGTLQYMIRYHEKGTEKELHESTVVEGVAEGAVIKAENAKLELEGYTYAGAGMDGIYHDKANDPALVVSQDVGRNVLTIYYIPDPDLHLHKDATLENDGTYTIEMGMFTHNNPVTTLVDQNIPLDIVLVLDQSSSMYNPFTGGLVEELKTSVTTFVDQIAEHSRSHGTDHRLAIVGYGTNGVYGATGSGPIAGAFDSNKQQTVQASGKWTNTGVYGAHGDFHAYPITGFTYTKYTGEIDTGGTYYTDSHGEYLLLTYHEDYRHLISAQEAFEENLKGTPIYGYVDGQFLQLRRNESGLWVVDGNTVQLYSSDKFFTWHKQVWTHRHGIEEREIHAYMVDGVYTPTDGHENVFIREETTDPNPDKSIYRDALLPVTMGTQGTGYVDPAFANAIGSLGAKGMTYVSYGMEMANRIFEANPLSELDEEVERQRVVVVFTDGKPGDSSGFDEDESNRALAEAFETKNEYGAKVFTVGIYGSDVTDGDNDQKDFLMGLSSNYPEAVKLEDVWQEVVYTQVTKNLQLIPDGRYFAQDPQNETKFYPLYNRVEDLGNSTYNIHWYYKNDSGEMIDIYVVPSSETTYIQNGEVNGRKIFRRAGKGYKEADSDDYYFSASSGESLETYFATIVRDLTTRISVEVEMKDNSILRDIMGQGLVLTEGTVISVYRQAGTFHPEHKHVIWDKDDNGNEARELLDQLVIGSSTEHQITSQKGIMADGEWIPYITVYNLDSANPTNPDEADYHPHTVDVTGYQYNDWYLNAGKVRGYRLVVTITRVEAMADVPFGHATDTNHAQSGLWLPEKDGQRQLLEAFDQPSTVFVERAYVLDYGKKFQLSGWYFDAEDDKPAQAVHVDCEIDNGMNWFDEPTTASGQNRGDTLYGNVAVENGYVTYTPTTTQWGGWDQFYVFGDTWRNTILTQDANRNGNLWNKVTVIPANNIYYEDSFVTDPENGIEGFTFTGAWSVVGDSANDTEDPEHLESKTYGEVHGWTDSLADDKNFTDGSAHVAFKDGYDHKKGARVEFSFTGTGVEVYSRTNAQSGWIVAFLYEKSGDKLIYKQSLLMDDLAESGDYYHIPTVYFKDLDYGTYSVMLVATEFVDDSGKSRAEYYIDGIRIINPMGQTIQDAVVKEAYGLETNAVFTEVRDILIDNGSFNADKDNFEGAVFIDQLKKGQAGAEQDAAKVTTYDVGVFEAYGPKNEVYLSSGQAIVLKVEEGNTYYVGLKSLKGGKVTANLSGIEDADPTAIEIGHTTDLYYRVTPVDGYIVIQNGSEGEEILSITNLRTTNLTAPAPNGGVLKVVRQEAVAVMDEFTDYLLNKPEEPVLPEEEPVDENQQMTDALFTSVRQWIDTD